MPRPLKEIKVKKQGNGFSFFRNGSYVGWESLDVLCRYVEERAELKAPRGFGKEKLYLQGRPSSRD